MGGHGTDDDGAARPVSLNRRRAITAGLLLGMALAAMEAAIGQKAEWTDDDPFLEAPPVDS